jgi:hypothetical protein
MGSEEERLRRREPPSRSSEIVARPRVAFASVAFAMAVVFAGGNLPAPLWPIYQSELHLSAFALMMVFSAYVLGVLAALFALGDLSDVIGRRPLLLASVLATIAASLLFAFAGNVVVLLAARFVQGLAVGGVSAAANAALHDFSDRAGARYPSVVGSIATSVGFASGPFSAGILAEIAPHPTQTSFFVLVAVASIAFIGMLALPNSGRRPGAVYRARSAGVPRAIRAPFARAAATFIVGWVGGSIFLALGPSIIVQLLGTSSHAVAGTTILLFFVASGLGQFALRDAPAVVTLRCGAAAMGTGLVIAVFAALFHSLALFFVAIVVSGAAQGIALLGGLALVNAIAPPGQRGGVLSAFFLAGYLPVTVVVPLLGWAADAGGLFGALTAFAACVVVASVATSVDLWRWKPQPLVPGVGA